MGVVIERFNGRMADDRFDGVDVDFGFEQMTDEGVTHGMRGKAPAGDAGTVHSGKTEVFLDYGTHSESREDESSLVDEESVGGGGLRLAPMMDPIELEKFDGRRPQGVDSFFVALADDLDGAVGKIEPGDSGIGGLAGACPGVIEENEDRQVTDAVGGIGSGLRKESFQLPIAEGVAFSLGNTFGGNGQDAFGVDSQTGGVHRNVLEERLDSGQALVAGARRAASPAFGIFQMLEEGQDRLDVDIFKAKEVCSPPRAQKGDEKLEGIAITADRVEAQALLPVQIGVEKGVKMFLEVVCHRFLKVRARAL